MWKVLGNPSLDASSTALRHPQRKPATATGCTYSTQQHNSRPSSVNGPTVALPSSATPSSPNINGKKRSVQASGSMTPVFTATCGEYRITGTIRKGATGYLYSAVAEGSGGVDQASHERATSNKVGDDVVLKVEDCAAPKRQMQNEWQVRSDRCIHQDATQRSNAIIFERFC